MILKYHASAEQVQDNLMPSVIQQQTQRRQQIARLIYDVWTQRGAEICGLAEPVLVDGRLDILSSYVIEYYTDINNNECSEHRTYGKTTKIDIVDAANLTYENFCNNYMNRNIPLVIRGLSDNWSCCKDWVMKDPTTGRSVPNLSHILQCYGNDIISVHVQPIEGFQLPQQRPETSNTYNMTVADYIKWWKKYNDGFHTCECCEEPLLYLKDWKFVASHPNAKVYSCPHFFRDDWLNDAKDSTYQFVYLGRKGTVTALHADVLRSFSWSTNISGSKLWYFIAPPYAHLLYDCFGAKLAHHLHADMASTTESDSMTDNEHHLKNNFLSALYPGLRYARQHSLSIQQHCGETIFVPSNWFHTVENVVDTLSINHNWLNGANVRQCWQYVAWKVQQTRIHTSDKENAQTIIDKGSSDVVSNVNDAAAENIDDDVFLMWEVVEKKAKFYIDQSETTGSLTSQEKLDLSGILHVCDGILELYNEIEFLPHAPKELKKIRQMRYAIETLLKTNAF